MTKNTFISRLLSFLSPRPCPICGLRIETGPSVICASCDMRLPRTGYAADPYENQMAKLYWGRIPIEKAAAFMFYHAGDDACNIIYDMKYHDHPDFCFAMGKLMAKEFGAVGFFDDIDIIMPIPLAASRQRYRGYNQSHEMAKGLSDVTGLPITTKAVKRTKFEGSQTKLGRLERLENMDGIWKLSNAEEVMDILQVKQSKAYQIIRQLNKELSGMGLITVPGRVDANYFKKKLFYEEK